jgi:hypothetical protein
MTKNTELLETIADSLRKIDSGLIQARTIIKTLEDARDTLRYTRNVIEHRVREFTDGKEN